MGEEKCVLTSCCCGCTLRTGAFATAIFCLISALCNVIYAVYRIVSAHDQASWMSVIVGVLTLIVACLLVHGIKKEKPRLVKIWVYVQIVITVFLIIQLVVVFVNTLDIIGLLFGIFFVVVYIYLILVVRSYALQLEAGGGTNTV